MPQTKAALDIGVYTWVKSELQSEFLPTDVILRLKTYFASVTAVGRFKSANTTLGKTIVQVS